MAHVCGAFTAKIPRFATPTAKQRHKLDAQHEHTVGELVAQGFTYVEWENRPVYLVDRHNHLFAVLTGYPQQGGFAEAGYHLFSLVMKLSEQLPSVCLHCRGLFPVVNWGIHHGQGPRQPFAIKLRKAERNVTTALMQDADFQQICNFQSGKLYYSLF